jgi:methionyl-tRNA formyltransferase
LNGKGIRVWGAQYDPAWPKYVATPGQVVGHTESGCFVKTGDSVLLLTTVQSGDGSPETPHWRIGTRLGLNLPALALALAAEDQGGN